MRPFLAFDSETTGLVNSREPPSHPSQPHLVQLAAIIWDLDADRELSSISLIVKPDGYEIPRGASDVHGITTETARAVGVPLVVALAAFNHLLRATSDHVAHNSDFDVKVLLAAYHRVGRPVAPINPKCTKNLAEPLLKLPPTPRMIETGYGHKFKAPTLTECVRFFFDEDLSGAHDALVDARACARVYREILRRKEMAAATATP